MCIAFVYVSILLHELSLCSSAVWCVRLAYGLRVMFVFVPKARLMGLLVCVFSYLLRVLCVWFVYAFCVFFNRFYEFVVRFSAFVVWCGVVWCVCVCFVSVLCGIFVCCSLQAFVNALCVFPAFVACVFFAHVCVPFLYIVFNTCL